MESLSSVQTKGVKRLLAESQQTAQIIQTEGLPLHEIDRDVLRRRRKRRRVEQQEGAAEKKRDDVLGFEGSSSSEEEEEEEENEEEEEEENEEENGQVPEAVGNQMTSDDNCDVENEDQVTSNCSTTEHVSNAAKGQWDNERTAKTDVKPAASHRPAGVVNVPVTRRQDIEEARSKLPIIAEEQNIMETVNSQPVLFNGF